MPLNLIKDKWLPVRREDGTVERIAPHQIAETRNPVIAIESGRPDFDGSLIQFLIGLLQTTAAPKDHDEWITWLESPPSSEKLNEIITKYFEELKKGSLDTLESKIKKTNDDDLKKNLESQRNNEKKKDAIAVFNLDGEGPKFMQDCEEEGADRWSVHRLLIDSPGKNTLRKNADHFVKRTRINQICGKCAASAIYTLQTNTPGFGRGHKSNLRRISVLTTLVKIDPKSSGLEDNLWSNVWINVLDEDFSLNINGNRSKRKDEHLFPWTNSEEYRIRKITTPNDCNPMQVFWGMPLRIRLDKNDIASGECDICTQFDSHLFKSFFVKPYGIKYEGGWKHPLSPYIEKNKAFVAKQTEQGGMSYRHWLGLVTKRVGSEPALVVEAFRSAGGHQRKMKKEQFLVRAFGYEMDKKQIAKARWWQEAEFPLFNIPSEYADVLFDRTQTLIETATLTADETKKHIKEAWFERPGDAKGDTSFLEDAFYHCTEQSFFEIVKRLLEALASGEDDTALLNDWHAILVKSSLGLFDDWAARSDFTQEDPRRIAKAHASLMKKLYSKNMKTKLKLPKEKKAA